MTLFTDMTRIYDQEKNKIEIKDLKICQTKRDS